MENKRVLRPNGGKPDVAESCRPGLWEGKTLFLDFDGTLVQTCKKETPEELTWTLGGIRKNAKSVLTSLRLRDAMCAITSAATYGHIHDFADMAGLSDSFDIVFDRWTLEVDVISINGRFMDTPKRYCTPINRLGIASPLSSCAIIGDNISVDVPLSPKGIVTVISGMDTSLLMILAHLEMLLLHGNGDFARGFDRIYTGGIRGYGAKLIREPDWVFFGGETGLARIVCFGVAENEISLHVGPSALRNALGEA